MSIDSPVGTIGVESTAAGLRRVHLPGDDVRRAGSTHEGSAAAANAERAIAQVEEYLRGEREEFDVMLDWTGVGRHSPTRARDAPRDRARSGRTVTYGELGRRAGIDDPRDVGVLMARNPIPLVVPCHRVVASDGLGGYGGGLELKRRLLELEGVLPPRLDFGHVSSVQSMELVQLGDSGLRASRVGLGCNNFGGRLDLEGTRAVVDAAFDVGVTFFDTAEVYGNGGDSERFLGDVLAGRRDEAVIATKFGWGQEFGDGSAECVHGAIDRSLGRLRTDYVDLYYLHKPDPSTPIADTLSALDELVRAGKVRAIGCSNFSAEQLTEADRVARELGVTRFTVLQNQYSLLERADDADVLPLCRELGVSYIPYFPLASGLLTGKYRRGEPAPEGTRLAGREIADDRFERVEAYTAFAEERGRSLHELAICALASTPGVGSIIAGATKPEQVRANAAAAAVAWQLSGDELDALAEL